ncbi:MAG: 23S rRNA (guanosine(2251)-2'-O)-methyltransferase RlmB [Pseudohongiella sp.]|nr:23S rRNA (guanosine(2251)-2'-O)-methyltransferase RlmB [Pseudohongiella sp.]
MSAREWIVGIHSVAELLRSHPEDVLELVLQQERTDQRTDEVRALAQELGIKIQVMPKAALEKKLQGESKGAGKRVPVHQGVAALCQYRDTVKDEAFLTKLLDRLDHPALILVLDEVTDPHNLGACLRTADAAGADAVIVPKDNSATMNMTVRKVASGAAEKVNLVAVTNLARTLASLQERGIWISGTAGEADHSLYKADFTGPVAIVMGSEGKGLRRLTREHCDYLISIPMAGVVSSLNVSVAAGVCLFEAVRQRQKKS